MKILHHPITVALGYTTLCLLYLVEPLISPSHFLIYHSPASVTPLFVFTGVNFCLLWLLLTALLLLSGKHRQVWLGIWAILVLTLPRVLLRDGVQLTQWALPPSVGLFTFVLPFAAFAYLYFFRRSSLRSTFSAVQQFVSTLLGFAALSGLALIFQFTWCAWQTRNLNPPFVAKNPPAVSGAGPRRIRVVWLLFDELSYQQVYERRFPGLSLPEFDRLAAQSTVFAHVVPTAIRTEQVIPSLFTGLPSDSIRVSADGQLRSLHDPVSGVWQPFDQRQTVFQDARVAGYGTGIAGWAIPYCRIMPEVLDQCSWTVHSFITFDQWRLASGWQAEISTAIRLFASPLLNLIRYQIDPKSLLRELAEEHIQDYEDIQAAADMLLADPKIDFVFLHIPVPHPEGIYDRKRRTFVTGGASYIDNLALADESLGHTRAVLESHGQWDSSMVIVMGDHSWRTQLEWVASPYWTPEDERASHGGQFDDRPAYVVKMPWQQNAILVSNPFKAIETRALLDAVLRSQLTTGEDLKAWAQRR